MFIKFVYCDADVNVSLSLSPNNLLRCCFERVVATSQKLISVLKSKRQEIWILQYYVHIYWHQFSIFLVCAYVGWCVHDMITDWEYLRTKSWGEYLDKRERETEISNTRLEEIAWWGRSQFIRDYLRVNFQIKNYKIVPLSLDVLSKRKRLLSFFLADRYSQSSDLDEGITKILSR